MSSLLEQEIYSQPQVITTLLEQETQHISEIVAQLPPFDYIVIAARGSSDHAATYAKYAWSTLGGYPIALAAPSLHTLYKHPPRLHNALVVGISQSGQSPDIVSVLEEAKRQGRPTIAITNDANSPLATIADHVVELHAGLERAVAATKTYTAQLAVMMLFAAALSGDQQRFEEIKQIPEAMTRTLERSKQLAPLAERYRYMEHCVVVGRGYNYSTSFELGLKLKELTYVMAISYSSADFRHGPIATIDSGTPTILIMPRGAAYQDMIELAKDLQKLEAELLIISDSEQALELAQTPMPIAAALPEWLSPITAILPGQVLALHLTLAKRLNPDVPRGLQKVTRTL
ncbi:glucosamine--fructose-6-phosphate aminotransferase (isomerizing) [Thermosporothrix hazakensis]|jgi:glucosamine--fructose-6-phosphate aminotransferase (isomerizing)|uniref:Glucosamine--fructose-6-phosphate aminotransferase (Isomerizing) n=2 Tax=Thermosporothrix TaxID=768650 RepID=A0A326UDK3_THEHA|nr:SIS domain-containing protein [Thermosporothrix hazakensis]PZW36517.1 glucosamine--fructose-6-phosphate aminotransferase (isomerizing) [Thermosporothrix hazakensis]BBH88983.1 glucosamine--fructose-6-phosphate aminotransferase [Thermosporothrix sp. COM3]GCE47169.1 glucosamine--fructose-6-phosphate aminotransferase [Thermosporothrix hazakensis]